MPTAFVATFGSGEPVLGFLAEYDALPRLSQKAVPRQEPLIEGGSGHGCGHNLFGKVFMAREGLFSSLSAAVDWHPGGVTAVSLGGSHAIHNFTVTFKGRAAHAGGSPWNGRRALDGIEVMNFAVNLMREYVKLTVRIHYAITEERKTD